MKDFNDLDNNLSVILTGVLSSKPIHSKIKLYLMNMNNCELEIVYDCYEDYKRAFISNIFQIIRNIDRYF